MPTAIFRVSSATNPNKPRLEGWTPAACLWSLIHYVKPDALHIVADRVGDDDLVRLLNAVPEEMPLTVHPITATNGGDAWTKALEIGLAMDGDLYFVEEDYLHRPGAGDVLREGLERLCYVSLYDHPDKYQFPSPNPYVLQGGEQEAFVSLGKTCHWRTADSTTMTFAVDREVLHEFSGEWRWAGQHGVPPDFMTWRRLRSVGERLITPMPGYATHLETAWLCPLVDWDEVLAEVPLR